MIANLVPALAFILALIAFVWEIRQNRRERSFAIFLRLLDFYGNIQDRRRQQWRTLKDVIRSNPKLRHEIGDKTSSLDYLLIRSKQPEAMYAIEHEILEREIQSLNALNELCQMAGNDEPRITMLALLHGSEISYYQNRLQDLLLLKQKESVGRLFSVPRHEALSAFTIHEYFDKPATENLAGPQSRHGNGNKGQQMIVPQTVRNALDALAARGERLAEAGWTLPQFLDFSDVRNLLETSSDSDLDALIVDLYSRDEGHEWISLRGELAKSELLDSYRTVIEQAFRAYERGDYLIVVPALLAALEGVLAIVDNRIRSRRVTPVEWARNRESAQSEGSMHKVLWGSIVFFTEKLWQRSDFSEDHPPSLNRHWILHGRKMQDVDQADALRLFQALHSITTLGQTEV